MLKRILIASLVMIGSAFAQERSITVASTTSTEQSGLFGYLLPRFTSVTGIGVKVVAVGTGQALDIGRRGDADVVFVHDRVAEEKFLSEGFALKRHDVMYNDFVVMGPKADPARIGAGCPVRPRPLRRPRYRRRQGRCGSVAEDCRREGKLRLARRPLRDP